MGWDIQDDAQYGDDHYLKYKNAYHVDPSLNNGNKKEKVLHIHEYSVKGDFTVRPSRLLTEDEKKIYGKYFIGVKL